MRIPLGLIAVAMAGALHAPVLPAQTQPKAGQAATAAGPADAARGKVSVSMCIGCHGIAAYKTAYPEVYSVPMIAGQSPQYIVKALEAYRGGDRRHPSMTGIARSLSDADMAELAAYYGGGGK